MLIPTPPLRKSRRVKPKAPPTPLVLVSGPGSAARNSIGTVLVSGMAFGTLFTLFVVPVFYSLIARDHKAAAVNREPALAPAPALEGVANA